MSARLKCGSLCSGYGGLELGLSLAGIDHDVVWCAETDKHASKVLEAHHPDSPNLGDLTEIDFPPEVDIVTAGFPCQPVSSSGKGDGIYDKRWLIEDVVRVASNAGARWLVLENVSGLFTANGGEAFYQVLRALAESGFAAEWVCIRASDVGAPHGRPRWFCVAHANEPSKQTRFNPGPKRKEFRLQPVGLAPFAADAGRVSREISSFGEQPAVPVSGGVSSKRKIDFGKYERAVRRWERALGREAPSPVDEKNRLNPWFVEWMMGLPEGWVCGHLEGRYHPLRVLGNGVVPQQAAYAVSELVRRIEDV